MLLAINPHSLFDKTTKGETILDLAKSTATKRHPNIVLIDELKKLLEGTTHDVVSSEDGSSNRSRLDSNNESLNPPQQQLYHEYHPHQRGSDGQTWWWHHPVYSSARSTHKDQN